MMTLYQYKISKTREKTDVFAFFCNLHEFLFHILFQFGIYLLFPHQFDIIFLIIRYILVGTNKLRKQHRPGRCCFCFPLKIFQLYVVTRVPGSV